MQSESTAPFDSLTPKAGVCMADGFGLRIFVRRRHLIVEDGIGRTRRERKFSRATSGIKRLLVLGHEGFVTLEALRWMADVGIAFIQLDHDGRLISATAPPGNDDARIRRAQALSRGTRTGLNVARWILDQKLSGQSAVLAHLNAGEAQRALAVARRELKSAVSTDDLMSTPEARGAAAYWEAWKSVPIQFVRSDLPRIPSHWGTFGVRRSPLSGSPRLAANPANAILNYLYRLLEAETRIACLAVGLDPGLGLFHTDKRGRDNLVMDLMEACRPQVDLYALQVFESRLFRSSDFFETRQGVCRILAPLTHQLAETTPLLATAIAPVVEKVARMLGKPSRARIERSPTPLTGANRSRSRDSEPKNPRKAIGRPLAIRVCRVCGSPVSRTRTYCDECRAVGGETSLRKAQASVKSQTELAAWRAKGVPDVDPAHFREEIWPEVRELPLAQLMDATGLSVAYCSRIRRGQVVPHARHWPALSALRGRKAPA